MKKNVFAILMLSGIFTIFSCKQNKKEPSSQTTTSESTTDNSPAKEESKNTKTYVVTASPDTVSLGKDKEAFIKLKDLKAIELSNPDGTSAGIEFTYKIELTNRTSIGGSSIGMPTTDFRLELDNGIKISPNSVFISAEPEATKLSDADKFLIPAGAKPTALNLFYNQTRATVKIELK